MSSCGQRTQPARRLRPLPCVKGNDRVRRVVPGVIATLVGITLACTACTSDEPGSADPTVPTAASSTAAPAPDVSKIPETIDGAYLDAVLAALDEVDGQATRLIYAEKRFTPAAAEILNAIYSDEETDRQADARLSGLANDPQLSSIRPNPGNRRTIVTRIITATPACVWTEVERDHTLNSVTPGPPRHEFIALRPIDRSNDPKGVNPTAWMITSEGFNADGSEPGNQCDGS